jgi:DNA-binding transcriptional regulator YiaG
MSSINQKIRQLRANMGWTREELARQLEVSLSSVNRWELYDTSPSPMARRALEKLFKKAGMNGNA